MSLYLDCLKAGKAGEHRKLPLVRLERDACAGCLRDDGDELVAVHEGLLLDSVDILLRLLCSKCRSGNRQGHGLICVGLIMESLTSLFSQNCSDERKSP